MSRDMNAGRKHLGCCHSWRKKIPLGCSWKFFTKLQPLMNIFSPDRRSLCFFHCPLMNNETALTHEEFLLHTHESCANAMPTWARVPRAVDVNICIFDKQAIQEPIITHIHCPLMNHSWVTHEPLMNCFRLVRSWSQRGPNSGHTVPAEAGYIEDALGVREQVIWTFVHACNHICKISSIFYSLSIHEALMI